MAHLLAGLDVKDLSRAIASSSDVSSVATESYAADHTGMGEVVDKLYVKDTWDLWVENRVPVIPNTLEVRGKLIHLKLD